MGNEEYGRLCRNPGQASLLSIVVEKAYYLVWWILSDRDHKLMKDYEVISLFI